eukprot:7377931-Prymnesium_polylepis.1
MRVRAWQRGGRRPLAGASGCECCAGEAAVGAARLDAAPRARPKLESQPMLHCSPGVAAMSVTAFGGSRSSRSTASRKRAVCWSRPGPRTEACGAAACIKE